MYATTPTHIIEVCSFGSPARHRADGYIGRCHRCDNRFYKIEQVYNLLTAMSLSQLNASVATGKAAVTFNLDTTLHARPRWYALYTLPRHEKAVADRLLIRNMETYLPLYSAERCWNHRRMRVELPLFPGYVFIKMHITDKARVLTDSGIIRLVSFNSNAAALPDDDIERLRTSLAARRAEPYPFLAVGKRVKIRSGPFAGMAGTILRRKGRMRLVVSLDFIQRAIVFELDAADTQVTS
jgi:transcription antitermination factor NusG